VQTKGTNEDSDHPAWSPDGKWILFSSKRSGNAEIYLMASDGTNVRRLTDNPAKDFWPSWQPTALTE
jgi:TolB protein